MFSVLSQCLFVFLCVNRGNLAQYSQLLSQYQDFFIEKGTYLLLEEVKRRCVYRNLFNQVTDLTLAALRLPISLLNNSLFNACMLNLNVLAGFACE